LWLEKYGFNLYQGFFMRKWTQIRQTLNYFSNCQICMISSRLIVKI
jgi:c-di-GMP-related signal transduction protein